MWPSVFRFHKEQRQILPGLPNAHVQELAAWGTIPDTVGTERGYLIQQWVAGEALDQRIKAGLATSAVLEILDDLFLKLIIPLWSQGSCWWDVRESNYVVSPEGRLMMIDSDTLGAYADEILTTPKVYVKRNHGSLTAMQRYTSLLVKLACHPAGRGTKQEIERQVRQLIAAHLQPVFCAPYPIAQDWDQTAAQAYRKFRDGYATLLRPVTGRPTPMRLRRNDFHSESPNQTNKPTKNEKQAKPQPRTIPRCRGGRSSPAPHAPARVVDGTKPPVPDQGWSHLAAPGG